MGTTGVLWSRTFDDMSGEGLELEPSGKEKIDLSRYEKRTMKEQE